MCLFSLPPKFDMKLELYYVINQVIDYYFAKIMDGKSYFLFLNSAKVNNLVLGNFSTSCQKSFVVLEFRTSNPKAA